MRELELDGIHDDAEHVVLRDSDGEQYTLRIDEALRAAVRRDRPALGMIQAAERAPLRPREIQAMLRSGRSAEEIAEIAGLGVEHVRRYEGPVAAERAFIAERARGFHVGRGGGPLFGELVTQRLRARQADPEAAIWDAWRRPDGTWTLELAFTAGGRRREGHWVVDMTRQSVQSEDDEARWLTDDDADRAEPSGRERPRLSAVRARVYDVEADGGVERGRSHDPHPTGSWRPVRPDPRDEHPASFGEDELDALNARRGLHPVPAVSRGGSASTGTPVDDEPTTHRTGDLGTVWSSLADPDAEAQRDHARGDVPDSMDPDPMDPDPMDPDATDPDEMGPDVAGPDETDPDGTDDEFEATEGHDGGGDQQRNQDAAASGREQVDTSQLTPLPGFDGERGNGARSEHAEDERSSQRKPRPKRGSGRGKRTSMPSWDEIVFGSKND